MSNIPTALGSLVRRSDLSEHVLYDLDAQDWHEGAEQYEWTPLPAEEQDRIDREQEALGRAGPPA